MDVQLYVYDLTRGMARSMSAGLLGIHLDAVYHTALVFNNIEYFFGRGIQQTYPGSTHHGRPMEVIPMGVTHLPMDTILEYLDGLRDIYSPESYDLFAHNCNNFTNDFSMFLVGKGIPEHITNLPRRVLETPIGQMLKSQIDASMREITQAPVPKSSGLRPQATNSPAVDSSQNISATTAAQTQSTSPQVPYGSVMNVTNRSILDGHLKAASNTAVTIFFTSSTCAPCKMAYPMFDSLAEQHGRALFVKVDINDARDIAMQYQIRATPTFVTFSKGVKQDTWSGADPNLLKANVDNMMQRTFPPHSHSLLKVPALQYGSLKPVTYTKMPPLDKLMTKLGDAAREPTLVGLRSFVEQRDLDPKNSPLPDLKSVSTAFQTKVLALPIEVRFAAVDLLRCAMVDPRVGGYLAEEQHTKTVPKLIKHVNDLANGPHNLRLVTIHLACNTFNSTLYVKELMQTGTPLPALMVQLITSSLLDNTHPTIRAAAASLAFNLTAANYRIRREQEREGLGESEQVELAAGILEALSNEENNDSAKALLLSFGYLIHYAPEHGEVMDLARALDAKSIIIECKEQTVLAKEIASLL